MYDPQEAGRLVYDCWCASHGNMEPVDAPKHESVVQTERDKQGKLVMKPQTETYHEPVNKAVTTWDDMPSHDRKRWVDMALAAITYHTTSQLAMSPTPSA